MFVVFTCLLGSSVLLPFLLLILSLLLLLLGSLSLRRWSLVIILRPRYEDFELTCYAAAELLSSRRKLF